MEPKLRDYIENLFATAPKTKQAYELREEIIRNTIDRYHDLLTEGKSEGEAYNLAIAGIGDINELLEALGGNPIEENAMTEEQHSVIKSRNSIFTGIAVALYILCVSPCILLAGTPLVDISPVFMFFMISLATGLLIYRNRTQYIMLEENPEKASKMRINAILKAVAIGMYISCTTPCILLASNPLVAISPVFMFLMIAIATVIVVFTRGKSGYTRADETMVESFKEFNGQKRKTSALYKVLVAILWITTSFVYIYLTIATGFFTAAVTWIIFLVAVAIQNLMKAIFDYAEARK